MATESVKSYFKSLPAPLEPWELETKTLRPRGQLHELRIIPLCDLQGRWWTNDSALGEIVEETSIKF